jgi:hypothetical protein
MSEWRRLSVVASDLSEEAGAKAPSDLREAYANVWHIFFQPSLEELATQCRSAEGCCDGVQRLQDFGSQACSWLDSRALCKVTVATDEADPVIAHVEICLEFAKAGAALAQSGICSPAAEAPVNEHTSFFGECVLAPFDIDEEADESNR